MNKFTFFLLALPLFVSNCFAIDRIVFRNGEIQEVRLYQITNEKIVYGPPVKSSTVRQEVSTKDIYMVSIDGQGECLPHNRWRKNYRGAKACGSP